MGRGSTCKQWTEGGYATAVHCPHCDRQFSGHPKMVSSLMKLHCQKVHKFNVNITADKVTGVLDNPTANWSSQQITTAAAKSQIIF